MNPQHLSDEAVAAFADGVLRGHPRERAARHAEACVECRQAVRSQREAVLALRSAPTPSLPGGLFERLRALPSTTPMPAVPAVFVEPQPPRQSPFAQMSALAPPRPAPRSGLRAKPLATGAAVLALTAGTLVAATVPQEVAAPTRGGATVTTRVGGADENPAMPQFVGVRFARR